MTTDQRVTYAAGCCVVLDIYSRLQDATNCLPFQIAKVCSCLIFLVWSLWNKFPFLIRLIYCQFYVLLT